MAYKDDPNINNEDLLMRRIRPDVHLVPANSTGQLRISSAAFKDHKDGSPMSVNIKSLMDENGQTCTDLLEIHANGFELAMAQLKVDAARSLGQAVLTDPLPDDPSHGLVAGKKTKGTRKKLAEASTIIE